MIEPYHPHPTLAASVDRAYALLLSDANGAACDLSAAAIALASDGDADALACVLRCLCGALGVTPTALSDLPDAVTQAFELLVPDEAAMADWELDDGESYWSACQGDTDALARLIRGLCDVVRDPLAWDCGD